MQWKDVPGFNGKYKVNEKGQVRGPRGRLLRPFISKGYKRFTLFDDQGNRPKYSAHTLVARAFHGERPEGAVCRHLDGNRLNNHISNLQWGTPEENYADRRRHGNDGVGEKNGNSKLSSRDVEEIRKEYRSGQVTYKGLAERYSVTFGTIGNIVRGDNWSHL